MEMTKEQKALLPEIKAMCEAIRKEWLNGATPDEIAERFHAKKEWVNDDDETYIYHNIDFEHFGVTFWQWQDDEDGEGDIKWYWENEAEIWLFDEDWAYWDKL